MANNHSVMSAANLYSLHLPAVFVEPGRLSLIDLPLIQNQPSGCNKHNLSSKHSRMKTVFNDETELTSQSWPSISKVEGVVVNSTLDTSGALSRTTITSHGDHVINAPMK